MPHAHGSGAEHGSGGAQVDHTHVPHYNMHGNQHHRNAHKNMSTAIRHEGNKVNPFVNPEKPMYKSRTELQQARKQHKVPHKSYDFDGDGHVGQRDFFIGKHFDGYHEDRLTAEERQRANSKLSEGWMDKFHFGHDRTGARRDFAVRQQRGVIQTGDNPDELGYVYPPHHNATKAPMHQTLSELRNDRKAELKNVHAMMKENWDLDNPALVKEPPHKKLPEDNCPVKHIRERALADHQKARVRSGLLPDNTEVNPERQVKGPTIDYVSNPAFKTRSQLLETRKELQREDINRQRLAAEAEMIPYSVRQAEQEVANFEFRRPPPEGTRTFTELAKQRKRDRVEYDMAHFHEPTKEMPRFSDQPHPWWTIGNRQNSAPELKGGRYREQPAECVLKVTDSPRPTVKPWTAPVETVYPPLEGPRQHKGKAAFVNGAHTHKRWTTELIEKGSMRNAARFFDTLQPMTACASDFAPLDTFSSFEPILNDALEMTAKQRKAHAHRAPMSQLCIPNSFNDSGGRALSSAESAPSLHAPPEQRSSSGRHSSASSNRGGGYEGQSHRRTRTQHFPGRAIESFTRSENPMQIDATIMDRSRSVPPGNVQDFAEGATQAMFTASQAPSFGIAPSSIGEPAAASVSRRPWGVRTGGFQRVDQVERADIQNSVFS